MQQARLAIEDRNVSPRYERSGWEGLSALIRGAAISDLPVLLVGEFGSGRRYSARLIHSLSMRSQGAFVTIRCASVSGELFASERSVQGKGTGTIFEASANRHGRFPLGGTLFLDEIGSLPEKAQEQVLRLMRSRWVRVERNGVSRRTDVRLVASSGYDLRREADAGRFERRLLDYFLPNTVRIPPLRERVDDVLELAAIFMERDAVRFQKNVSGFDTEAIRLLKSYQWPGNAYELRNVIERAVILADSSEITSSCLPNYIQDSSSVKSGRTLNLRAVLAEEEKNTLIEALRRARGVRREAARLLGVDSRNLAHFLRKHGLEKKQQTRASSDHFVIPPQSPRSECAALPSRQSQ